MKAFCIYLALSAVAINVVGNAMAGTKTALEQRQADRIEKLCAVNAAYCK